MSSITAKMGLLEYFIYLCLLLVGEINGYRTIKSDKEVVIFAKSMEAVDIICENDVPLVRCGFTHPNGTKLLFKNLLPGTPLCKYTTDASSADIGLWTCHYWSQTLPQEEMTKTIEVRVAHKFGAVDREIRAGEGEEVSLSCISTERMVPLDYCYFMTPERERLYMDQGFTRTNALMQKYFFPLNKSLHRGDCGVTIISATPSDSGIWSCYGWLELENRQYVDTIRLVVENDGSEGWTETSVLVSDYDTFTISLATYVCGTCAFLCFFAVLVYWKYKYYSTFSGKTWGDDESIDSYVMKHRIDDTPVLVNTGDYLLIT